MIPSSFDYVRPKTITDAKNFLASEDAVVLAGGHTLLTQLKWRKLKPRLVVDINDLPLQAVTTRKNGELEVGATVRQSHFFSSNEAGAGQLLEQVCRASGDPLIRARGTVVGAMCAAEKGGDWGAAALALGARLKFALRRGSKEISYEQWLSDSETNRQQRLALSAVFPKLPAESSLSYFKAKHAAVGWAIASLAIVKTPKFTRIAVSGVTLKPSRLEATEQVIQSGEGDLDEAWESDFGCLPVWGDSYASATYRRKILRHALEQELHRM